MDINILWLITARSGSTSIRNKNIKYLGNLPLLAYKIKTALSLSNADNVWISTDSEKYAAIAKQFGATIPFIRPKELATNNSRSEDVVLHAMNYAEQLGRKYDFIGLLEPTSPFVYAEDIKKALLKLYHSSKGDAIVAVRETRPNTFFIQEESDFLNIISKRMESMKSLGRQFFKKEITPSGGFYISKWDGFFQKKTFYTENTLAYEVAAECELEIDEPMDWLWAEFLINNNIIDLKKLW